MRKLSPIVGFIIVLVALLLIALALPASAHSEDNDQAIALWSPGQVHRDWEFVGSNQDASYWFATQNRGAWLGVTLKVAERSPDGQFRTVRLIEALVRCQANHHAPSSAGFLGVVTFDVATHEQLGQYVSQDIGGTPVELRPSSALAQAIDDACQEQGQ